MKKTTRRKFISTSLTATALVAVGESLIVNTAEASALFKPAPFQFKQVPLPFKYADLEPYIDALTNEIHYTKHHTAYIKNVNDAIVTEKLTYNTEGEFFANASKLSAKVRNNAGGAWNHNFFWESLIPGPAVEPSGKLREAILSSFGTIDKFKDEFSQAALGRFGSGWTWLVVNDGKLKIGSTPNQDNPLFDDAALKGKPLLALDVWEHAYYLKYQNKRNEYIAGWWNVINWENVSKRYLNI